MMFENLSTRKQGDLGLTFAIYKLTKEGYTVSIPITDNQGYDIVIEKDLVLYTVQVKSTKTESENGHFIVQLKSVRPNRTRSVIINYNNMCDYLGIATSDSKFYLIPSSAITCASALRLTDRYDDYILGR